ncbi:M20/M25/M40 family metallo-hydrolase [Erythrobacter sp. SDW2]|uniref:M20/M25/M40 family metallo-hydrolase n=1 Tax=Erythrobacter sp. SDW2 TaxID=2907154 RepID=UPI001F3B5EE8|nr:M20/M25/M40 family metallo-hydrolase [Erythrobacter sp. SDW2]UIP05864.1 M20/M25/M40 family metallo-hydrolase [Erythrobacter sp. SDW2]
MASLGGKNWLWLAGALVVALLLAIVGTTPPQEHATPSGNPAEPESNRAYGHIRQIAKQPHPTGSAANAEVRAYLVGELERMGLTVETSTGTIDRRAQDKLDHWDGEKSAALTEFVNIIGVLPGTVRSLPAVALMAHYDSVWGSPGAADDATGVAVILEAVRAIAASGPQRRDIVVILTDAEELGLNGARDFYANHPLAARIGAIVNVEARGGGGISSMFQTSPGNAEVARLYAREVSHPAATSLSAFIYSVLPNDTDLSPALERGGYAAWNIAFIGRSGLYHSPLSIPENVDRGSIYQMLSQTHELAAALAEARSLPAQSHDAVFFDVFGQFVLVYAPAWGWVMLALGAIGYGIAWGRRRERAGSIAGGAARMAGLLIGGGILLYLLNLLSGAGTGAGYYDRLAAIPKLTGMVLLALTGVAIVAFGARRGGFATRVGAVLPLAAIAIALQAYAPPAAFFIVIPLMLAGLVEMVRSFRKPLLSRASAALVAAVMTGFLLTLGFFAMQGVGPSMPWVTAILMALAMLTWLPLWQAVPKWRIVAGTLLLAASGMALFIRFDPVPPTVAVYSPLKPG